MPDNRVLGDPGTPAFQVEKYPFFLLNRLVSRYNVIIESQLRPIGLDIPYWRVLMVLGEHSPRGVRDIADAAVIPLSTMTRIIQRMTSAGLVKVKASRLDGRVSQVTLTGAGKTRLGAARKATAPIYQCAVQDFSRNDFDKLLTLLNQLHENLNALSL